MLTIFITAWAGAATVWAAALTVKKNKVRRSLEVATRTLDVVS